MNKGPTTRAKRALSRIANTRTTDKTRRRNADRQEGSKSVSRAGSPSAKLTEAASTGGIVANRQPKFFLDSSPSQTGTISARLDSREVSPAPSPDNAGINVEQDGRLPEGSDRGSATANVENVQEHDTRQAEQAQPANPSISCLSCLSVGAEINELKGRVQELQEDKMFARNSANILAEENKRLKHRVDVLQKSKKELFDQVEKLSKRRRKPFALSKRSTGAPSSIRLPEAEQTIFDRASNMIEGRLFEDITESTTDEDGHRLRDWILQEKGSSRVWILNDACEKVGRPMISRKDTFGAVPVCPLEQAISGGLFTSRYGSNENFIHNLLLDAVEQDDPPLIPLEERDASLGNLEKMLTPLYNAKKRKLTSDLKKRAKCRFLSALGYTALGRISSVSVELEQREREREVLRTKLSRTVDGDVDISWWRQATFEELRFSDECNEREDFVADLVFKNSAAVLAFQILRGFNFSDGEFLDDGTVLSLARADSWITVSMNLMKEKRSKGGNTGSIYASEFDKLLPIATEKFLRNCRMVMKEKYKSEFIVKYRSDNPFTISRRGTRCFRMPHTKQLYLAVRSSVFTSIFTKHLGTVLDCYIGKAVDRDTSFRALSILEHDNDCDTSDEEERVEGSGTALHSQITSRHQTNEVE